MATLNAKVADLAMPTASAGTAALSGWGWQPGFTMQLFTEQTGSTSALFAGLTIGTGFAVGTSTITQFGLWLSQNDAQNPASTTFIFDNALYGHVWSDATNAGSTLGQVTVAHDAGGLTLTAGTTPNNPAAAYESSQFGLDSAAFSNMKIGSFTSPLSTGNQATTDPGFKPDVVIFFLTGPTGGALPWVENQVDANNPNGWMMGATNGTNQWVANVGVSSEGGDLSPKASRYFLTTKCIAGWFFDQNADGAGHQLLEIEASIVSLDTNGFTLNFTTVDTATNYEIGYVALKMNAGYNVDVHSVTTPTSTGAFSKTGMSFKPSALIGCNINKAASTAGTADTDLRLTVGVTDGTASRCRSFYSQDLGGTAGSSVAKSYQDMSNFLSYRSGSGSTAAEAIAFTSFNTDGYTLNSTTAPAAGSATGIIAFGPGASAGTSVDQIMAALSTVYGQADNTPRRITSFIPHGEKGGG